MPVRISELVIDCTDPEQAAEFWCAALAYRVLERSPTEIEIGGDDSMPSLLFALVDDPKLQKVRIHIDVSPVAGSDRDAEVARLERLGARRVDVGQPADASFVVLVDPDGHEFCVLSRPVPPEPHPFARPT